MNDLALSPPAGIEKELKRIHCYAFSDVSSKYYDRYDYFKEKQTGLEKWGTWLWEYVVTADLDGGINE